MRYGPSLSLKDLFEKLFIEEADSIPSPWWRSATTKLHWYEAPGRRFYSDFKDTTDVPDLLMTGFVLSTRIGIGGNYFNIDDRYGNKYRALSVSFGPGFSVREYWEGYVNRPGHFTGPTLDSGALQSIVAGPSLGVDAAAGAGLSIIGWDVGHSDFYGLNPSSNAGISFGYTWQLAERGKPWAWVDYMIPGYDASVRYGSSH